MSKRKWLSALLAVAMVLTMLPVTVFAAGTSADVSTKEEFLAALGEDSITTINITSDLDLTDIQAGAGNVLDISGRTVDLGGHTITANNFALIYQGSDFVIQNGIFDGNGGAYALFIGDGPTSNVIIQNVTTIGGINVYNSTDVVLRDVDVTGGKYYAVWCDEGGQVKIESGVFQADQENGTALLGMAEGDVDSTLNIEGGTFHTNGKPLVLEAAGKDYGDPVISGGTFSADATEYAADGCSSASIRSDGETTYYIGTPEAIAEKIAEVVKTGDTVTVIKGNAALTDLPDGVTVENSGDGDVSVNGDMVTDTPIISHTHTWGAPVWSWNADKTEATATFICTADESHVETVSVAATSETTPATCGKAGKTVYTVSVEFNGETYTDTKTVEISATGHGETEIRNAKAATCTEEGYTGDKVCKDCGEVVEQGKTIAKVAHTYKNGKCTVCGVSDPNYRPTTEPTEPTEPTTPPTVDPDNNDPKPTDKPTSSPQTGDNSNIWLWVALLFISAGGVLGTTVYVRKRQRTE